MRHVYINGKMVPEQDAKISIYDSALMFGDMVFEMTRSVKIGRRQIFVNMKTRMVYLL